MTEPTLVAHPPERARRSTALLSAGCCCCCCCCIHSLGSLAGALYGMRGAPPPEERERREADRLAVRCYWWSLLGIAVLAAIGGLIENRGGADSLGVAAIVAAVFLPAGQLGASALALIYINVFPPAQKIVSLRRLGRITLFSFVWGLIGAALTWILAVSFKW